MKALTRIGAAIAQGLEVAVHKGARFDHSTMTDQQLWALAGIDDSILTGEDKGVIASERERIIADPKQWAANYVAEKDTLVKEISKGIFQYLELVSFARGDHLAGHAVWLAGKELEDLGVFWPGYDNPV